MDDGGKRERQLGRSREIVVGLEPKQWRPKIDGKALDRETLYGEEWHGEEGEHLAGEILERQQPLVGCAQARGQEAGGEEVEWCSQVAEHVVAVAQRQIAHERSH